MKIIDIIRNVVLGHCKIHLLINSSICFFHCNVTLQYDYRLCQSSVSFQVFIMVRSQARHFNLCGHRCPWSIRTLELVEPLALYHLVHSFIHQVLMLPQTLLYYNLCLPTLFQFHFAGGDTKNQVRKENNSEILQQFTIVYMDQMTHVANFILSNKKENILQQNPCVIGY